MEIIFNVKLTDETHLQASLPIKCGGLGIRQANSLALSAYIASIASASQMDQSLATNNTLRSYQNAWQSLSKSSEECGNQREYDKKICVSLLEEHIQNQSVTEASRVISACHKNSGDWLKVTPNRQCGIFLNNEEFRHAVALRLGSCVFEEHKCKCGGRVDAFGTHCFVCSRNNGRILRQTMVNDCVSSSLRLAGIPNIKEPQNTQYQNNVRPDGISLIPFQSGKCLAWDVSCPHPLRASHAQINTTPGSAASAVEVQKENKYSCTNYY